MFLDNSKIKKTHPLFWNFIHGEQYTKINYEHITVDKQKNQLSTKKQHFQS